MYIFKNKNYEKGCAKTTNFVVFLLFVTTGLMNDLLVIWSLRCINVNVSMVVKMKMVSLLISKA
ncbi:hypothetical protein DH09_20630 [Bacillaceae bacterium JMAK1]|nr:hypothetical protein DH09_20630 [Bacillaceae bacterium JMAK1]